MRTSARMGLYAYDFSGALVWKASVGNIAKAGMGPGTSPVIWEDLLILQCDQEMGAGSAIVALNRHTGKEVWRTDRTTRRSWATPLTSVGSSENGNSPRTESENTTDPAIDRR